MKRKHSQRESQDDNSNQDQQKRHRCLYPGCTRVYGALSSLSRHKKLDNHKFEPERKNRLRKDAKEEDYLECQDCKKVFTTPASLRCHNCKAKADQKQNRTSHLPSLGEKIRQCVIKGNEEEKDDVDEVDDDDDEENRDKQPNQDHNLKECNNINSVELSHLNEKSSELDEKSRVSLKEQVLNLIRVRSEQQLQSMSQLPMSKSSLNNQDGIPQVLSQSKSCVDVIQSENQEDVQVDESKYIEVQESHEQLTNSQNMKSANEEIKDHIPSELTKKILCYLTKYSALFWTEKDHVDLQAPIHTRSSNKGKNLKCTQLDQSNAQIGYGEPTHGSFLKILAAMKEHYWEEAKGFVDIGSGFGKAVFFFAIQTNMECFGYDIVPARVQRAEEFKRKLSEIYGNNPMILNAVKRTHFELKNCGMIKKLETLDQIDEEKSSSPFTEPNQALTHFFCFNYVFQEDDSYYIAQRLKQTPSVKVLIWCSDKSKTLNKFGLDDFEYVKTLPIKLQGSGQQISVHVYRKRESPSLFKDLIQEPDHEEEKRTANQNLIDNDKVHHSVSLNSEQMAFHQSSSIDAVMKKVLLYHTSQANAMQEIRTILSRHRQQLNFSNEKLDSKEQKSLDLCAMQEFIDVQINQLGISKVISPLELDKDINHLRDNIEQCQALMQEKNVVKKVLVQVLQNDKDQIVKWNKEYEKEKKKTINMKKTIIQCFKHALKEKHEYKVKKVLTGGFGIVFHCDKLQNQNYFPQTNQRHESFAIKISYQGDPSQRDEIDALDNIHKKGDNNKMFIVKPLKHFNILGKVALVMEWIPQNLSEVIVQGCINDEQKRRIACFVTRGLACAHKLGIPHRDIKPLNILLDNNLVPKICDWGLTKSNNKSGTKTYMPPEYQEFEGRLDGFKADSWSLGLLIFFIYEERVHYDNVDKYDPSQNVLRFSPNTPAQAQDLILKLTLKDKFKRLQVQKATDHELFAGIEKVDVSTRLNIKELKSTNLQREEKVFKQTVCDK